jgi:hypothetical protein
MTKRGKDTGVPGKSGGRDAISGRFIDKKATHGNGNIRGYQPKPKDKAKSPPPPGQSSGSNS